MARMLRANGALIYSKKQHGPETAAGAAGASSTSGSISPTQPSLSCGSEGLMTTASYEQKHP